jgi:hypothetical protein
MQAGILVAARDGTSQIVGIRERDRLDKLWRLMDAGGLPFAILREVFTELTPDGVKTESRLEAVIVDEYKGAYEDNERLQVLLIETLAALRRLCLLTVARVEVAEVET